MRRWAITLSLVGALLALPGDLAAQPGAPITLVLPEPRSSFFTTDSPLFIWEAGSEYVTDPWDGATLFFRRPQESPASGFGTFVPFPDEHVRYPLDFVRRGGTIPGDYLWKVCLYDSEAEQPDGPCSGERHIRIKFRLPTLRKRDAGEYADRVFERAARRSLGPLTLDPDHYRRKCRRRSRVRLDCRVSSFAGDSVVTGKVAVRLYRRVNSPYYSAVFRGRQINEYCVFVTKDYPCSRRVSKRIGGRHVVAR